MISAPVASHTAEIAFMLDIRCARNALATCNKLMFSIYSLTDNLREVFHRTHHIVYHDKTIREAYPHNKTTSKAYPLTLANYENLLERFKNKMIK